MIFVFGSNKSGVHGAGAAKYAFDYKGAVWGKGEGHYGDSYALPTKGYGVTDMTLPEIYPHVERFCEYARDNPNLNFELTPVGTGLAGHPKKDVVQMFKMAKLPSNVLLSSTWITD